MAHEELAARFRKFGEVHCEGSTLYRHIALAVAESQPVLGLVAEIPPAQRVPNLLLAAVHDLLLAGVQHPLAAHYPSLRASTSTSTSTDHGAAPSSAAAAFIDFCLSHRAALRPILASRATQTNEVGRAAALLPAVGRLSQEGIARIGLVDLGASAGLNLFFDRYHITYVDDAGVDAGEAGDVDSPVRARCVLRGAARPDLPIRIPTITDRSGLDQSPLDVRTPDDVRWLLACVWPDQPQRFVRLRAALELAKQTPPRILRGALPEDAARAAALTPNDVHLVLLTTWVLAYLSVEQRARLDEVVDAVGRARDLTWILTEQPHNLPFDVDALDADSTAVVSIEYRKGRRRNRVLGDMHGHGTFLRWRADSAAD